MSRSRYKITTDPYKRDNEVLQRHLEGARKYQYRAHRKPPNGHLKHDKKAKVELRYPPKTGWPGGHPDNNKGFKSPQK